MDILDQDIERDDNELHNTQVVQIKGFATSAKLLGIFFFLLGTGGVLFSGSLIMRHIRYRSRGWDYDTTFQWEPLILFGVGGFLSIVAGWYMLRSGIKSTRDVRNLRNISSKTLKTWNRGIILVALTLAFVALFMLYLIVKYGID